GIEKVYDEVLQGSHGLKIIEADALGKTDSESTIRPAQDGENLTLSIDASLQRVLYETIRELALRVDFRGGTGGIMDVRTGEIIALTSYPEYSSQVMTDGDDGDLISDYLTDSSKPFLNRFISGLYTP